MDWSFSFLWRSLESLFVDSFITLSLDQCLFSEIEYLLLFDNTLGSTISPKIGQLTKLKSLFFGSNLFTGGLPIGSLQNLTNLEVVNLSDNSYSGALFDAILSWPKIQGLSVDGLPNAQWSRIPTEIGLLTQLENFLGSKMYPMIPTEMTLLSNLSYLYLFDCKAPYGEENAGPTTIPTDIGRLTHLTHLDLEGLQFLTGTLPTELALLTNLKSMNIRLNDITGELPSEIGRMTALTELDVAYMPGVKGTVPSEYGSIAKNLGT